MLDLVKRDILKLNDLKFFVLDECDQMLTKLGNLILIIFPNLTRLNLQRHETGGLGDLQKDSPGQIGHDV